MVSSVAITGTEPSAGPCVLLCVEEGTDGSPHSTRTDGDRGGQDHQEIGGSEVAVPEDCDDRPGQRSPGPATAANTRADPCRTKTPNVARFVPSESAPHGVDPIGEEGRVHPSTVPGRSGPRHRRRRRRTIHPATKPPATNASFMIRFQRPSILPETDPATVIAQITPVALDRAPSHGVDSIVPVWPYRSSPYEMTAEGRTLAGRVFRPGGVNIWRTVSPAQRLEPARLHVERIEDRDEVARRRDPCSGGGECLHVVPSRCRGVLDLVGAGVDGRSEAHPGDPERR